ncbi:MAG: hypothetical protein N2C12_06905, partial [Planctomycetales bacterium]
ELGVCSHEVELLGQLSDLYVFASNFLVTPWVAVTAAPPRWVPEAAEVAEVLEIPVDHLADPANFMFTLREISGVAFRSPYFGFQRHEIWGATCLILSEFIAVVQDLKHSD